MDIYVVSNVWREQATIVGAAIDPDTAEELAERHRRTVMGGHHAPGTWGEWTEQGGVRSRGSLIWRARQEIVTVPLAGYVEEVPIEKTMFATRWANGPVTVGHDRLTAIQPPEMPKPPTMAELLAIMDRIGSVGNPGPVRVGKGEAWDWLRRGLDQMATYPSEKALPDSVAAQFMGIDVQLDPNLPPDVIRFGDRVYVIDEARGVVYEMTALAWDSFAGDKHWLTTRPS